MSKGIVEMKREYLPFIMELWRLKLEKYLGN